MKKEYVIWGVEKGTDYEQLLYTKAVSYEAAIKTAKLLEEKFDVTKTRIQIIDFSVPLDFTKIIKEGQNE